MAHAFALFFHRQRPRLGLVVEETPERLTLRLAEGARTRLPVAQALLRWEGGAPPDLPRAALAATAASVADDSAAPELAEWEAWLGEAAAAVDVAALHAALPPGEPLTLSDIEQFQAAPPPEGWGRAALLLALLEAPRWFRRKGGAFFAQTAEQMAGWDAAARVAAAEADWAGRVAAWGEALDGGAWPGGEGGDEFLEQVTSLLAFERRSPHWRALAALLGLNPDRMGETRSRLRGWLETAGAWPGWPAIWLPAAGVERTFPEVLESEARALTAAPLARGRRAAEGAVTLDTAGAADLDDACTVLDAGDDGLTVAVHVTRLPDALRPGHPLFEEAARRMTSVYTLAGTFPMFPEALSSGRFSLLQGEEREVVTFTLRVAEMGAALVAVEEGVIRVASNLDYREGARLIKDQPETWGRLSVLCGAMAARRKAEGAMAGERLEVGLDVSNPDRIGLTRHDRRGPAQQVVEELAVIANREAGRFCRDHDLPAFYRISGSGAVGAADDEEAPPLGRMPWARFSTEGAPHPGLACDRYVQVTSPIRRFPDLIMQQQLLSHVAGGPLAYPDPAALEAWAREADARMASAAAVEQRIAAYWKRRYLAQHPGLILRATVRRSAAGKAGKVWLEEVLLAADAQVPPGARPGDPLTVRLERSDPEGESARVKVIGEG